MTANDGNTDEARVKQEQQQQQQQQQPGRGKNANGRRNNRQQNHRPAYKSKVTGLESAVFSAKGSAAAFSNNIIAIADYIVGPETKHQYEVGTAIRTRKPQSISEPTDPGKDASSSELKKYEILFKEWVVRLRFLHAQGYEIEENVVYQDNQSAILLEKNGKFSSSKRTKHVDMRYFFITDRIEKKEVSVEYCPTEDMIGDFFTKPLQGSLFRKFRALILNTGE